MTPPPAPIAIRYDPEGHTVLYWRILPPVLARIIAALLLIVAIVMLNTGVDSVRTLLTILPGAALDYLALLIVGVNALFFCGIGLAAAALAVRLALNPQPELITLHPQRLVYEPGSAVLSFETISPRGLLGVFFGRLRYEIPLSGLAEVTTGTFRRVRGVILSSPARNLRIGVFLGASQQAWLVATLNEWRARN